MITRERLESAVQNILDLGKGMKRAYYDQGETQPYFAFLLDHHGNEQKSICSFIVFDEDDPTVARLAKNSFKHAIKKLIKKHKSHGVVIVSDTYTLDGFGNRNGECLMAHGEAKSLRVSSFLPYTANGTGPSFDEEGIITADDAEGPWTGYFK